MNAASFLRINAASFLRMLDGRRAAAAVVGVLALLTVPMPSPSKAAEAVPASACAVMLAPAAVEVLGTGATASSIGVTAAAGCSYSVISDNAFIVIDSAATAVGSSTVRYSVLPNTGPTRKGSITIGGIGFGVKQAKGVAPPPPPPPPPPRKTAFDFDGDGKADVGIYRPGTGTWYLLRSRDGFLATQFGLPGRHPGAGRLRR